MIKITRLLRVRGPIYSLSQHEWLACTYPHSDQKDNAYDTRGQNVALSWQKVNVFTKSIKWSSELLRFLGEKFQWQHLSRFESIEENTWHTDYLIFNVVGFAAVNPGTLWHKANGIIFQKHCWLKQTHPPANGKSILLAVEHWNCKSLRACFWHQIKTCRIRTNKPQQSRVTPQTHHETRGTKT